MKDLIKEIFKSPQDAAFNCAMKEKTSDLDEFYCAIYKSEKEKWGDYFGLSIERPERFQILTSFLAKISDESLLYLNKDSFQALSMVLEEHYKCKSAEETTKIIVTPETAETVEFKNFAQNLSPKSQVYVSSLKEKELSDFSFQMYNFEKVITSTKQRHIAFLYPNTQTKQKRISSLYNSFGILLQHSVRYSDFLNAPKRITSHQNNTPFQKSVDRSRD